MLRSLNVVAEVPLVLDAALLGARALFKLRSELLYQIPFRSDLARLNEIDWGPLIAAATDPRVKTPAYFKRPFHGILGGNDLTQAREQHLSMQAIAAEFGHARGMRDQRGPALASFAPTLPARPRILALGCGTGDEHAALKARYPTAVIWGVDLSPEMVAVGRHRYPTEAHPDFLFQHAAAESTGLAPESFDLVSACALHHELPKMVSEAIFAEAHRVLKPGGHYLFIDQDRASPTIRRQLEAGKIGRLIEPFLKSYLQLDVPAALAAAGFEDVTANKHTPDSTLLVVSGRKPLSS